MKIKVKNAQSAKSNLKIGRGTGKEEQVDAKTKVLTCLRNIPPGRVCTYGTLAQMAGLGKAARFVGNTLKHLPADSSLPWHRVVNSQGKPSFPPDSQAHQVQLERLIREKVIVINGKIDLKQFAI